MICSFCEKEGSSNSISQHIIRCKLNPNKIEIKNNFIKYNNDLKSGLIKKENTNQFSKAKNENMLIEFSQEARRKLSEKGKNRKLSEETKIKIKKSMMDAVIKYPESYSASNINGRTKKILYNGFIMDGSWELEVAKWLDNNKIKWTKKIKGFEYEWNGKRIYYPDFYLLSYNVYLEVKGYERERDKAKWKVVDNLIVLKKREINMIKNNIDPSEILKQ